MSIIWSEVCVREYLLLGAKPIAKKGAKAKAAAASTLIPILSTREMVATSRNGDTNGDEEKNSNAGG